MYKKKALLEKISNIFKKHKLGSKEARISAEVIINAELVGAPSHGVSRLKMYCERIKKKLINPKAIINIKKISNSISLVNANNSIGFVAADIGIKQAISNAKKTGIGLVGVRNSGHYGLSSYFIQKAVSKNLIAMCFTNAPPAIAPYGAKRSLFGTNPIAFGFPSFKKKPFIFDSSMSKINRGKIRVAAKLGKKIPYGVALDKNGKITTSAKKALEGVQLPMGDFRGSGLAWVVDILSGVVTGSAHSGKVKDPFDDFSGPQNIGHLFIVFKANLFNKRFKNEINKNIKTVKRLPKLKGVTEIKYPGQKKYERYQNNLNKNIYLSKKVEKELEVLLRE
tara:strand:+ start:3108 stop:4118 length:1011 start_codon:yes stop_codon:yes gene_type:complete